jgi:hypothetical protein
LAGSNILLRYLEQSTIEPNQGSNGYGGPEFDLFRSDPRFAQIIKKVGFPIE